MFVNVRFGSLAVIQAWPELAKMLQVRKRAAYETKNGL
jgi:hypothetical protein